MLRFVVRGPLATRSVSRCGSFAATFLLTGLAVLGVTRGRNRPLDGFLRDRGVLLVPGSSCPFEICSSQGFDIEHGIGLIGTNQPFATLTVFPGMTA